MKCGICNGSNWVDTGFEYVCGKCGFVSDDVPAINNIPGASKILLHHQEALGSEKIIADDLPLPSINKKRTAIILTKHDDALINFSKCCNDLRLSNSAAQIAFHLFKKLRYKKLGIGRVAVFCISYACIETGMIYDEKLLIDKIQCSFNLKRKLKMSHCIYKVKPVALAENLVSSHDDNLKYLIKKYVAPDHQIKAIPIINLWNGRNAGKNIRTTEDYLRAYT